MAGPEECYEKVVTIAGEKPEEVCNLEPQTSCKHVTKLVPQLKPHESCVDVPKEVCTRSRTNPRKVKKPVIKKWCYNASPESGLEPVSVSDSAAQPAEECPAQCARSVASGQCDPECEQWEYLCGPCVPKCPDRCGQVSVTPPALHTMISVVSAFLLHLLLHVLLGVQQLLPVVTVIHLVTSMLTYVVPVFQLVQESVRFVPF